MLQNMQLGKEVDKINSEIYSRYWYCNYVDSYIGVQHQVSTSVGCIFVFCETFMNLTVHI